MLEVYIADVSRLDPEKARLSHQRLEKLARLTNADDKRRCAGAELLLTHALGLSEPPKYSFGEHGKPYLAGGSIYFSLSHSGKYALCAISDVPVGADIERPRAGSARLARRFFTPREAALINSDADFCRLWVQKESYVKALGTGLAEGMSGFDIAELDDHAIALTSHDGYDIAVCLRGRIPAFSLECVSLPDNLMSDKNV